MHRDAKQTEFRTYLSAILVPGLSLNALLAMVGRASGGPHAALIIASMIAKGGIAGLEGEACHECASLT